MKKILSLSSIILVLRIAANSQITLDFQSPLMNLYPIKLTNNETKYYYYDYTSLFQNNTFSLYNLDGSLYKIVQMPPKPNSLEGIYGPYYISRTLFDNDPSNIEYVVQYNYDSVDFNYQIRESKVIREDGTILLDEIYGSISLSPGGVYATEEGTKLMLSPYYYANGTPLSKLTKVFNLPGEIPTSIVDKNSIVESSPLLFPNPNNGSFYIKFNSENKENFIIELYSFSGKFLDSFVSSTNLTHINNLNLPSGMYFLNAKTTNGNQMKNFIIQK